MIFHNPKLHAIVFYHLDAEHASFISFISPACYRSLGMENGKIPSSAITASTYYSARYSPNLGRLNSPSAWAIANPPIPPHWLQVDLGGIVAVKMVATQGMRFADFWVTSYLISSSVDGIEWVNYMENNTVKVSLLLIFSLVAL